MGYTCYYTFEGVTYKNLMDMCSKTGRNAQRVRMRLSKGMSLDEAMSIEKITPSAKVCRDHLGNHYKSMAAMCGTYGISVKTFRFRIGAGWHLEKALTTPVIKGKPILAPNNKMYNSITDMCSDYGVDLTTYESRISKGMSMEEALTHKKEAIIVFGNTYSSKAEVCREFNHTLNLYCARTNRLGFEPEVALVAPPGKVVTYVGVYNKRKYYSIQGQTKLVDMLNVVRLYRPDLEDKCIVLEYNEMDSPNIIIGPDGSLFKSILQASEHYNLRRDTLAKIIKSGLNPTEAIQMYFNIQQEKEAVDMQRRLQLQLKIEQSNQKKLEAESNRKKPKPEYRGKYYTEYNGRVFRYYKDILDYLNVTYEVFTSIRNKHGFSVLETIDYIDNNKGKIYNEITGEYYESIKDAARKLGISDSTIHNRIKKGYDIHLCFLKIPEKVFKSNKKGKFIGLNNKCYYYTTVSKRPLTVRDIIEMYHPSLVDTYDRCNPNGEYKPYKDK